MEQELHQVVRDQQHQAQSVEAERMGRRETEDVRTEDMRTRGGHEETTLASVGHTCSS